MSGPIVRKYGFPNFEKIFGERKLEHGVDEPEKSENAAISAELGEPQTASETPSTSATKKPATS
jgi:hypothetical protein